MDIEDGEASVEVVADHDVPIMPRGAGSSLAGQGVWPGCVVVDVSRHIGSRRVDPSARTFATDFHSAGR